MEKDKRISQQSIDAGKRFIENIKSGKIRRDLPPINVDQKPYSDKEDYDHFLEFTKSDFYKQLLEQE